MSTPYKKTNHAATVIVRRRSGTSPSSQPIQTHATATSHTRAKCGHPLDRGRSPNKDCRACCRAKVAAERQASQRTRALKAQKGRLPDGAHFDLTWSADVMKWTGTLVTTIAGREVQLSETAVNSFTLLRKLDIRYRALLPENTHLRTPTADRTAATSEISS